jgi:hypothetical protein
MKRSEFWSVATIEATEEIKISEGLQGHTLPAAFGTVPLKRQLMRILVIVLALNPRPRS